MRLPFPEKISLTGSVTFAVTLGAVQLIEGTDPVFTGLCILFILLATVAFNFSGGIAFPSGAYVGSNAVLTLILPLCVKALLGEAADTNLAAPVLTLEVYVGGMVAMLLAVVGSRYLRPKKPVLTRVGHIQDLRTAYYGVALTALIITPLPFIVGGRSNGSILSFLNQINRFPVLAFLLGVAYTVQRTRGRRSVSVPLAVGLACSSLFLGLLTFSKEAFLFPLLCWVMMLAVLGFNVRGIHLAVFAVLGYIIYAFMTPYASVGRNTDPAGRTPTELAGYLLTHMDDVQKQFDASSGGGEHALFYYGPRLGLLDRMEYVAVDSALIAETDNDGYYGYQPAYSVLANFVPHFLWKDKPLGRYGNAYAHQIEVLSDEDYFTGVSFSPSADAYHEGGFAAVFLWEPVVMLVGFLLLDSVIGDVRNNFVGLAMTGLILRISNEGLLYGGIQLCAQPIAGVLLAAVLCAHIFPILGELIGKSGMRATVDGQQQLQAS